MELLGLDFSQIYGFLGAFILAVYNSNTLLVIKFLLGIYSAVLLVDIVMLLIQRGLAADMRDTLFGMDIPEELVTKKKQLRKKWDAIKAKLKSDNESDWKVAIIEADNLIDDLLKRLGYKGENMGERLEKIVPGQIENLEGLKAAHDFRNQIIHEEGLKLTQEKAKEILDIYEEFLNSFEVFD